MNKLEVQAIVDQFPYERYGRVNLPYGLHTKGLDRSQTKNLIFPTSLKGKSVLDVGCAYGYLCFEAEDLGAAKIIGLETKPARLKRANLFKEIRQSKAQFINQSILDFEFQEKFDYIVILNVLHHLKDQSVLEKLIHNTKERFIIESPYLKRLQMSPENAVRQYIQNVEVCESSLTGPEAGARQIVIGKLY